MPDVASLPVPQAPPILSTPDTRIFEESVPVRATDVTPKSDTEILKIYEIERVADEIGRGQWTRVALQFPDHMLVDAPRVSQALSRRLDIIRTPRPDQDKAGEHNSVRIFILADTSYGACCVDEVAAEHSNADVVVHYGRTCLSPTSRLPVIYCYTEQPLSQDAAVGAFCKTYQDRGQSIILMADLPYQHHLPGLAETLQSIGYTRLFVTTIKQDPRSPLPNRTIPPETLQHSLHDWALFHVAEPTPSLLLTLTSRVSSISFLPIVDDAASSPQMAIQANTNMALRRRYALLTSLATIPIFGILINTLSVRNYMDILAHVKDQIARAGKKSYTFVVGKVNAAKIANFSEVGGWVVIGCWESSLFEAKDFWKPLITPFELELALQDDSVRLWTGRWTSDFQEVLDVSSAKTAQNEASAFRQPSNAGTEAKRIDEKLGSPRELEDSSSSEEESAPPEFDLRTGRYVSHSRPMERQAPVQVSETPADGPASQTLMRRPRGDVTTVAGQISPAADFFHHQRSWQGLGSDYNKIEQSDAGLRGATMEQGRHGIARGYHVGDHPRSTKR